MGYGAITQGSGTASTPKAMFTGRAVDATDYVAGKEDSKVIVVEYSDPECPFCVQVSPTIKRLRSEYSDKVAFVFLKHRENLRALGNSRRFVDLGLFLFWHLCLFLWFLPSADAAGQGFATGYARR